MKSVLISFALFFAVGNADAAQIIWTCTNAPKSKLKIYSESECYTTGRTEILKLGCRIKEDHPNNKCFFSLNKNDDSSSWSCKMETICFQKQTNINSKNPCDEKVQKNLDAGDVGNIGSLDLDVCYEKNKTDLKTKKNTTSIAPAKPSSFKSKKASGSR